MRSLLKRIIIGSSLVYSTLSQAGFDTNKWYRIKPMTQDGLCYDVECGSEDDCSQVILYKQCNDHRNQQFKFERVTTNSKYRTFYIIPKHAPTKVLDICEGSIEDRARCILYHNIYRRGYGIHRNQEFSVNHVNADLYRISNFQSGIPLGFDENRNVCQMLLDYSHDTLVQLEEVESITHS